MHVKRVKQPAQAVSHTSWLGVCCTHHAIESNYTVRGGFLHSTNRLLARNINEPVPFAEHLEECNF